MQDCIRSILDHSLIWLSKTVLNLQKNSLGCLMDLEMKAPGVFRQQTQYVYLGKKMNEHDRENLQFLLNAGEETLRDWYSKVDEDDHEYASEIMTMYSEELAIKSRFYAVEEVDLTGLIPDAESYLKKFSLGKKQ